MSVKRRPYRSDKRRLQAEETRQRVLASSRDLFLSDGYGESTIEAIAQHAKVAAQTIYATFGSKRGILFALLDQMANAAALAEFEASVAAASGNPRQQLREGVAFNVRFYAAGIDLIEIARTVSGVEADLQAMWHEGEARRYRAQSAMVAEWARAKALRPNLAAREASDELWALSGPDVFRLFVIERGWSKPRFEKWLFATLERALFGAA